MFKGLVGANWLGGFGGRRMASMVERADYWTGTAVGADTDLTATAAPAEGLAAATLIATDCGWKAARDLVAGDRIVTFDHGLVSLRGVTRSILTTRPGAVPRSALPLSVPAGALGNRRAMTLLPGQAVLIESDRAEALYGDPFVLIPAAALDGWNGISRTQPQVETEVVFLDFGRDELVYAEGMTLVQCGSRLTALVATADDLMAAGQPQGYPVLPPGLGRALLAA